MMFLSRTQIPLLRYSSESSQFYTEQSFERGESQLKEAERPTGIPCGHN